MNLYMVARSATTNRPMCQHTVVNAQDGFIITACGRAISGKSSEYTDVVLKSIMCQRCLKKEEK